MKSVSILDLFRSLTTDLEELTECSLNRDFLTVERRFGHEGLPFLTQTLPSFGKYVFQSLKGGTFQHPPAFKRKVALPVFLHGLTSRVFDAKTGVLLKDPCYVSMFAVRQYCFLLYKYEVAYTQEQLDVAFQEVIDTDVSLDGSVQIDPLDKVFVVAESIIADIFRDVEWARAVPRHGPGSTNVGQMKPWEKYAFGPLLPSYYDESFFVAPTEVSELDGISSLDYLANLPFDDPIEYLDGSEIPISRVSKVSAVSKNSSGPRIIGGEAVQLMWQQLGVGRLMVDILEKHPLTKGHFNFHDQSVNAKLALYASKTGRRATLDMSKASDRIARKLCGQLLPSTMFRVLDGIRSTHCQFPDGRVLEMAKMAPMGNGFCFPLESLVFWALATSSVAVSMDAVRVESDVIEAAAAQVFTYGDDLIVPTCYAESVMADLERYGFRFNRDKSYWTGPFRESCGIDAFNGVDITPLKIKKQLPKGKWDVDSIVGWVDAAKTWRHLLPHLSNLMEKIAYDALGFRPVYPEGWLGCLGDPVPYSKLKGREVTIGQPLKPSDKTRKKRDDDKEVDMPALAPSKGKVIKVCRIRNEVRNPSLEVFPEESRYLRWYSNKANPCDEDVDFSRRSVVPEATGDTRSFSLRYTTRIHMKSVFVS